jgi:hypothetical protein
LKLPPVDQRIGSKVGFRSKAKAEERARQAFEAARRFGKLFGRYPT